MGFRFAEPRRSFLQRFLGEARVAELEKEKDENDQRDKELGPLDIGFKQGRQHPAAIYADDLLRPRQNKETAATKALRAHGGAAASYAVGLIQGRVVRGG